MTRHTHAPHEAIASQNLTLLLLLLLLWYPASSTTDAPVPIPDEGRPTVAVHDVQRNAGIVDPFGVNEPNNPIEVHDKTHEYTYASAGNRSKSEVVKGAGAQSMMYWYIILLLYHRIYVT